MRNKENRRSHRSQEKNVTRTSTQRSYSLDKHQQPRYEKFNSMIFASGRSMSYHHTDSLCSPKDARHTRGDTLQSYMEFISSGRIIGEPVTQRGPYQHSQRKAVTPVPKRISQSLIEQGRRSVMGRENSSLKKG